MKKLFSILLLGVFLLPTMSFTTYDGKTELLEIADVLQEVESNNNPEAIGDGGLALGTLQIHEGAILDVNKHFGTEYTHDDATDPKIARDIFVKYISLGVELYKLRCGHAPNEYDIVRMWNGGIYRGYEYPSTLTYLRKYQLQKELARSQVANL